MENKDTVSNTKSNKSGKSEEKRKKKGESEVEDNPKSETSTNNGLASEKPEENDDVDKTTETNKSKPSDEEPHIEEGNKSGRTRGIKRKATNNEVSSKNETSTSVTEQVESNEHLQSNENVNDMAKENKEPVADPDQDNQMPEELGDDFEDQTPKTISETDLMGKGKRARIPNKRYSDIALSNSRKSLGLSKSSETESEEMPIKEEPMDSPIGSPSLQTKRQRQSTPSVNLQDPKYLKPFKFGWKRELVWRSTSTTSKPVGDVYYYTPTGKKVRSFRELSEHLTNKNLALENFSFFKDALGIDDPEKEIIRDAKVKLDGRDSPAPKKVEVVKKPRKVSPPKMDTPQKPTETDEGKPKTETPTKVVGSPAKKVKLVSKKAKKTLLKKTKTTPKVEEPMEVDTTPVRMTATKTKVLNSSSPVAGKVSKRNFKLKSITNTNPSTEEKNETKFMENYLQNLSFGYNTLLYVFQYLKVQDLLRAGCVCTMWRDIARHPILWRTVRMKNSQVHSFEGLANTLKKHGTIHLDLRKMLLPSAGDEIWAEFSKAIERVDTLRKIELCRCPASVVEQLAVTNPNLEVINAVTIKCESMNLAPLKNLTNIKELRLKSTTGLNVNAISSLKELKSLKILSLTSVNDLHKLDLSVIAELTNLESLDLGECTDFPKSFGQDVLAKLENLEKLRLEKGQGNCHTFEILEAVKNMRKLEQLELVNFDVKTGFDKALGSCQNIKKLMIIPTYISQSATTNNMVLSGVLRLQGSLSHFVWGVTLELLRVTELFVDQCEEPKDKKEKKPTGNGDSIPVLKPVPDLTHSNVIQTACNPPQVEILPLPNLQKLLLNSLPTTRVKILKIPFHATWRQTLTDSV